ncbi:penicillin-binding transpeptidase domain-containing protein [Sulfurimonas sp. NWX79]|uniref:penicillin-binding transpeptidase domain-containing protein n=1 Tax=Sulfurimonas sp. NWX79 TaxID=2925412 RepID=UPI003204C83C
MKIFIIIIGLLWFTACSIIDRIDNRIAVKSVRNSLIDKNGTLLASTNENQKRFYPYKKSACHILGYVKKSNGTKVGVKGLEKYYDVDLSHTSLPLKLTLDINLTQQMSKLFENKSGGFIVMDIDGAILSAGSFPQYDLNIFINGTIRSHYIALLNSPNKPFVNKLVHNLYDVGELLEPAYRLSNNNHTIIQKYGFGGRTGVDMPNEFHGFIPSDKSKNKNILVTPMQIANFTALLATAKLPTPHFIQKRKEVKNVLNEQELQKLKLLQKKLYSRFNYPKELVNEINNKFHIAGMITKHNRTAWVTSYAPYENPQYIVIVFLENSDKITTKYIMYKIYNYLQKHHYIKVEN